MWEMTLATELQVLLTSLAIQFILLTLSSIYDIYFITQFHNECYIQMFERPRYQDNIKDNSKVLSSSFYAETICLSSKTQGPGTWSARCCQTFQIPSIETVFKLLRVTYMRM